MENNDITRLRDVLEAIERAEIFLFGFSLAKFKKDKKTQSAVEFQLAIIGEAAGKLSKKLQRENQQVLWPKIISMRNLLIHDYSVIDSEEVWKVCRNDLPKLKTQIEGILSKIK